MYTEDKNTVHPFSIIAIKDIFNTFSNRFLLYYDERWKCDLFPNYRTVEHNNTQNLIEKLSNDLHIEKEKISVDFRYNKKYTKFSVSAQTEKLYDHSVYLATITGFTDDTMKDSFEIGGKRYKWATIPEMEADPEIIEKNMDIVQIVKHRI